MVGFLVKSAEKIAGRTGLETLVPWGGVGLGAGAVYGIASDNESMISGAFKGATLGSLGALGAKYGSMRYIDGLNSKAKAVADQGLGTRLGSLSPSASASEMAQSVAQMQGLRGYSRFDYGDLSIGKAQPGWWGSTASLSADARGMRSLYGSISKDYSTLMNDGSSHFKGMVNNYDYSAMARIPGFSHSADSWNSHLNTYNEKLAEAKGKWSYQALGLGV